MPFREPTLNISATATANVTTSALASSMTLSHEDASPEIFSTASLLALMDRACAQVLRPYLDPGDTSVSARVDFTHSAPTPLGAAVKATARYLGRDATLFKFEVVASDPGGEIGRAYLWHARVLKHRIEEKASLRQPTGTQSPTTGKSLSEQYVYAPLGLNSLTVSGTPKPRVAGGQRTCKGLHRAIEQGHQAEAWLLLSKGVDLTERDIFGWMPLQWQ